MTTLLDIQKEFQTANLECEFIFGETGLKELNWTCLVCHEVWMDSVESIRKRVTNGRQCVKCRRQRVKRLQESPVGVQVGLLTVESEESSGYLCSCVCGKVIKITKERIKRGDVKSCGCLRDTSNAIGYGTNNLQDLTGRRVGRLRVVQREGLKRYGNSSEPLWRCCCDCGREVFVAGRYLRYESVISCGCLRKIYLDGDFFASWVEAAVYLDLKKQGKRFFHNRPYGGLGRSRYDFYLPDEDTYIEVTGYNSSIRWWFKYLRKIVKKKHYVEDNLHSKFVFINRLCTSVERESLVSVITEQRSRFVLPA